MTSVLVILIIASAFVCGLSKGDVIAQQKIQAEIKQVIAEQVRIKADNDKLNKEIDKEMQQYQSKIKINEQLVNNGSTKNIAQQKELETLYRQLTNLQLQGTVLSNAPETIEKLKLGVKVINENINALNRRRRQSMTKKCYKLENTETNHTKPRLWSFKTEVLTRSLPHSNFSDTLVLENDLRLEKGKLALLKNRNEELKKKKESVTGFYEKQNANLNSVIKLLNDNHVSGQASIEKIKKEIQEQTKRNEEHKNKSGAKEKELEKWQKEGKKVWQKYNLLNKEISCYKNLIDDFGSLVTPVV